jgi:hypothetical protein
MVQTLQVYIYLDMQISQITGIGFRLLAHESHDLSQAEKKITVVKSCATDKMTTFFAQNDNFNHFE